MGRITDISKAIEMEKKNIKTLEEQIYIKLSFFETEQEEQRLFTKAQLNVAIVKGVEMLAHIVKTKAARELVLTMISELERVSKEGVVSLKEVKEIGNEIIKRIERTK